MSLVRFPHLVLLCFRLPTCQSQQAPVSVGSAPAEEAPKSTEHASAKLELPRFREGQVCHVEFSGQGGLLAVCKDKETYDEMHGQGERDHRKQMNLLKAQRCHSA